MNAGGKRDGILRVWITLPNEKERLVVDQSDLEWRNAATFGVDGLYFESFHGGNDSSWAPTRPCFAEFSQFKVVKPSGR
jgi:hypothetical protein